MPLFELEEGTMRKFYRITLDGLSVHLHWGRIGTDGQRQTLAFETEDEARAEYDAQLYKRTERGYKQVHQEDAPHDAETARRAKLAVAVPLTKQPRFRFVKAGHFAWLEASDTGVWFAKGRIENEATTEPDITPCLGLPSAIKLRDAKIADLVAKGYALDEFGAAEPVKKTAAKLADTSALERDILDDPFDEACWSVLEDFLLERETDPRSRIIRFEKSLLVAEAAQARGAIARQLLGSRHVSLSKLLSSSTWRAGFLQDVAFTWPARDAMGVFTALLAAPAARLMRTLDIMEAPAPKHVIPKLPATVRRFGFHSLVETELDTAFLERHPQITSMRISGNVIPIFAPAITRLRELAFDALYEQEALTAMFEDRVYPHLRALAIDGAMLRILSPAVLDAAVLPALESLQFVNIQSDVANGILQRLAKAPLPKLRVLRLGELAIAPSSLPAPLAAAFAHLDELTYPE